MKKMRIKLPILIAFVFMALAGKAGNFAISTQSGSWSDPATWQNGIVPGDGLFVTISVGNTVTFDKSIDSCAYLTINGTLQHSGSGSHLLVKGTVYIASTGVYELSGSPLIIDTLTIKDGDFVVDGTYSFDNSKVVFGGSASSNLGGMAVSLQFYSLEINKNLSSSSVTLSVPVDIINSLDLTRGIISNSSQLTVYDGSYISRAEGSIAAPAMLGQNISLTYSGSVPITATGYELPDTLWTLYNYNTPFVMLNKDIVLKQNSTNSSPAALYLQEGYFDLNGHKITIVEGNTFVDKGTVSATPTYQGNVSVSYDGSTPITTGNELPDIVSGNLTINNTVTLAKNVKINTLLFLQSGNFNLKGYTVTLADGATLERHMGTISATPVYDGNCTIKYSNDLTATAQELPPSIYNLAFTGSQFILDKNVTVTNQLSLNDAILTTNANALTMGLGANIIKQTGYINGNLAKNIQAGTGISKTFEIGTDNGYSPMEIKFAKITTPGLIKVSATQAVHPDNKKPAPAANYLQRYWSVKNTGLSFDSCSAVFHYLPQDFNTGVNEADDESNMIVGKFDGSKWNNPKIGLRNIGAANDGGSIEVKSITSFSDFTIYKEEPLASGSPIKAGNSIKAGENFPNPFTASTLIKFELPENGKVSLEIFDVSGRLVANLLNNEYKTAGAYTVKFNGANLPVGTYFYKIKTEKSVQINKMLLVN